MGLASSSAPTRWGNRIAHARAKGAPTEMPSTANRSRPTAAHSTPASSATPSAVTWGWVGSPVARAVDTHKAHAAVGQQAFGERPGRREPGAGHPRKHDAGHPLARSVLGEGQPPAVR
jgi:hypothetical protein